VSAALAYPKHHKAVYLAGICMDDAAKETFEAAYRTAGNLTNTGYTCGLPSPRCSPA
jgi:hypothetical protein